MKICLWHWKLLGVAVLNKCGSTRSDMPLWTLSIPFWAISQTQQIPKLAPDSRIEAYSEMSELEYMHQGLFITVVNQNSCK